MTEREKRCEVVAEQARRILVEGTRPLTHVTVHLKDGCPSGVEFEDSSGIMDPYDRAVAGSLAIELRAAIFEAHDMTGHLEARLATGRVHRRVTKKAAELIATM